MSEIEEVGATLDAVVASEFRGLVVDFWSPWCGPCRPLRRQLARIADERVDRWRFVAVNAHEHPEVAEAYEVKSLPTVVLFRHKAELHRFIGAVLPAAVETKLASLNEAAGVA